ncbi:YetF domain-containing protein [Thalassobacillus pellis]|uniref:YetF domain-containing protein n=1 Tax=Thalassobacillus pellis TaxID=748008 RepID=UPI003B8367B2|nr:uncharacterized membrane protein YcaP (DUF421 family) [Thalassobacillus pellis]
MATKPFSLPQIVIKEGKIHKNELQQLGRDDTWLMDQLTQKNEALNNVLLATLDEQGNLTISPYQ